MAGNTCHGVSVLLEMLAPLCQLMVSVVEWTPLLADWGSGCSWRVWSADASRL